MGAENGKIFDRMLVRARRDRAAENWESFDFLKREAALRIADAVADVARDFPLALDLGCHQGEAAQALAGSRVGRVIGCDFSERMLRHSPGAACVCDEEFLPFAERSFDLAVSALSLHHVNDLPGTLAQLRRALKPDGLFLAAIPGAATLSELRAVLVETSAGEGFALSPRLSPLIEVRDAGALLQRAGFALPVASSETVTVRYTDPFRLLRDLRGMGEGNVLRERDAGGTTRAYWQAVARRYRERFGAEDGSVPATFEFVSLSGWRPHASQPLPAARGSGEVSLKSVL